MWLESLFVGHLGTEAQEQVEPSCEDVEHQSGAMGDPQSNVGPGRASGHIGDSHLRESRLRAGWGTPEARGPGGDCYGGHQDGEGWAGHTG